MNVNGASNGPLVKGEVLIGLLDCIKGMPNGGFLHERMLSCLPDDSAGVCMKKIIAIADYPYSIFTDCIRAMDKVQGSGDLRTCRDFGKTRSSGVIQSFSGIFNKDMKIEDLFVLGDAIWNNNHVNSGYIKIEDPSPDSSLVRIYDFPDMDPAHCLYMEGFLTQALVEFGAIWIEEMHEVKCASRGGPYHEFVGRWKYPD